MIHREFPADQLTPVTAYVALALKTSCLLETTDNKAANRRYSFIGIESMATFTAREGQCEVEIDGQTEILDRDPYLALQHLEKRFGTPAVGIIAYDAVRYKENIPSRHSDLFDLPDFLFQFYQSSLLFDHDRGVISISAGNEEEIALLQEKLMSGQRRLPALEAAQESTPILDLSDTEYGKRVEIAKKHIVAGDLFQIVLSRTFQVQTNAPPFQIYRALRQTSPAPYLFFFELDGYAIAGASPEKLISVENGRVESMPIAGTCAPDGSIEELLADPKECAEHVMLVDLARNDIGAVCIPGTVKVAAFKQAQCFSHATHIVSQVVGQLDPRFSSLEALKVAFPAGTLTGAPKVRAMECIDALETSRRGFYGGAIVALDGKGNLKSCIAIRMAFIKDGTVYVRAGGGVVLDSDPQGEADETRLKASTVLEALKMTGVAR